MQNIILIFQEHIAYSIMACLGTILYLFKLVSLFLGGNDDSGIEFHDISNTSHWNPSEAFKHLSLQAIFAFLMGAGWMGLACREVWQLSATSSLLIATLFGLLMLLMTIFLASKIRSLNHSSVYNLENCKGNMGRAYTDIPLVGQGSGQVMMIVSGKQQLFPAISISTKIGAFTNVEIISVSGGTLLVSPINQNKE